MTVAKVGISAPNSAANAGEKLESIYATYH